MWTAMENDGNENFTPHTITTNASGVFSVYAADVDGDGDIDVLSASWLDNKIAWYQNDGSEIFTPHTITTSANGAQSVYAVDVDGDGDIDVLSASGMDDKIAWYEHLYSFSQVITIAEAREDLNGDFIPDRLGDTVTVEGVVFTPNFAPEHNHYYIDDGSAGIHAFAIGPHLFGWNLGDYTRLVGEIFHFNGATEIVALDSLSWLLVSTGNPTPDPIVLTIAQYLSDPEAYEGSLIELISLTLVGGTWPSPGNNALVQISDGLDTLDMLIDRHTDIDNNPEPSWPRDIMGVGAQNTSNIPPDDGYQLLPRFYSDFLLPSDVVQAGNSAPVDFALHQNYPNPFNPTTTINYQIPELSFVTLKVYNVLGSEMITLVNEEKPAGSYEVEFDGLQLTSGIYFYQLKVGSFIETKKMVLMK
jgi:hypothetical protein